MAKILPEDLTRLQIFVNNCKKCPDILHQPPLSFFKEYIESLGGQIPPKSTTPKNESTCDNDADKSSVPPSSPPKEEIESEESDVEIDNEGVIEPEKESLPEVVLHDPDVEISEENRDKSDEKRNEAMSAMRDGNLESAVELFTEAQRLNPSSAALFAKRANCLLKQNRVCAVIKDCTHAISLNPDSALAFKLRGRAQRLLGNWLDAAKDLRLACKLDCDEQAMEWLKEVQPNATKLEEHERKKERRKEEKEINAKKERVRKAREAQEEARKKAEEEARNRPECGMPGFPGGMPGFPGGMPGQGAGGMPDLSNLENDPDILQIFSDPELSAAFADISSTPANIFKYKDNPKIIAAINKIKKKFGGDSDGMGGMPGMGGMGGMPGMGGMGGMPGMGGMGGMPGMDGMGGMPNFGSSDASNPPSANTQDDLD